MTIGRPELRSVIKIAASPVRRTVDVPQMVDVPELKIRMMRRPITGGQMTQLVKFGYDIQGHNADPLIGFIRNKSNTDKEIGDICKVDADVFAAVVNDAHGRKLMLPSVAEVKALLKLNKLSSEWLDGKCWLWTSDKDPKDKRKFIMVYVGIPVQVGAFCGIDRGRQTSINPNERTWDRGGLLVESLR